MSEQGLMTISSPPVVNVDIQSLLDSFYSGKSRQTIEAYRKDLQDFQRYLKAPTEREAAYSFLSLSLGEANSLALQYLNHLLNRKLQATTINRRLSALRSLSQMAKMLGMIPWTLQVKNQKTESYRDTRGPGIDNFKRLLSLSIDRGDKKGNRDTAILRLLFDLGLRRGELLSLNFEDLDTERKTVMVLGKGRTQKQILSLPDATVEALVDWINVRGQDPGPLFTNMDRARKGSGRINGKSIYRLVRGLGEKIGIKTRPHAVRHTAITQAIKTAQAHGMGLEEVLDFSRHKDVKTIMVYRDRERNVQGQISQLIAQSVGGVA